MNGTRLLDANLVEANIAQIACKCAKSDAQKALVGRILFMIDNMPAVDAQPVKRGRWIGIGFIDMYCSECGNTPDHEPGSCPEATDYCPYCGSFMED